MIPENLREKLITIVGESVATPVPGTEVPPNADEIVNREMFNDAKNDFAGTHIDPEGLYYFCKVRNYQSGNLQGADKNTVWRTTIEGVVHDVCSAFLTQYLPHGYSIGYDVNSGKVLFSRPPSMVTYTLALIHHPKDGNVKSLDLRAWAKFLKRRLAKHGVRLSEEAAEYFDSNEFLIDLRGSLSLLAHGDDAPHEGEPSDDEKALFVETVMDMLGAETRRCAPLDRADTHTGLHR